MRVIRELVTCQLSHGNNGFMIRAYCTLCVLMDKLYKVQCENFKRRNFFTERIVNVWNSLAANVDFSSLSRFKRSIAQVDFSQFLKCDVL